MVMVDFFAIDHGVNSRVSWCYVICYLLFELNTLLGFDVKVVSLVQNITWCQCLRCGNMTTMDRLTTG